MSGAESLLAWRRRPLFRTTVRGGEEGAALELPVRPLVQRFCAAYSLAVLPARVKRPRTRPRSSREYHGRARRDRRTAQRKFFSLAELDTAIAKSSPTPTPRRSKARGCRQTSSMPRSDRWHRRCPRAATIHRVEDRRQSPSGPSYRSRPRLLLRALQPRRRARRCLLVGRHDENLPQGALIATHPRATHRYQRRTIEAHQPPEHQAYRALRIDALLDGRCALGPPPTKFCSAS